VSLSAADKFADAGRLMCRSVTDSEVVAASAWSGLVVWILLLHRAKRSSQILGAASARALEWRLMDRLSNGRTHATGTDKAKFSIRVDTENFKENYKSCQHRR